MKGTGKGHSPSVRPRSCVLCFALVAVLPMGAPCGAAVPALDHIIVVVMENKDWSQVRNATYITTLRNSGAELTNSYGVTQDASQPNYLALWAGSTLGVVNNNCPPPGSPYTVENLGHALETAGKTWRAYSENLPSAGSGVCATGEASPLYTRKHEPWTDFSNLNHNNERIYSDLAIDITNHTLPTLAFVIPNNCDNMHNTGCTVTFGDTWLSNNLPAMIGAVGSNGIVILTWDEDAGTTGNNNHILTVFKGQVVRSGIQSPGVVTHYNLLRTICDALAITPIGAAAGASAIDDIWVGGSQGPPVTDNELRLSSPTPNPSSTGVTARLWLPEASPVEAGIYDLAGHSIRALARGVRTGAVDLQWDGRRDDGTQSGAGVYFLKVRVGARALEQKAVLLR